MAGENNSPLPNPSTGASHGGWFEPEITYITPEGILWTAIALLCLSAGILILLFIAKDKNFFLPGFQSKFKITKKYILQSIALLIAALTVTVISVSGFLIYEYVKNTPCITTVSIFAVILAFVSFAVSIRRYY